jgi:hypothetical protein
MNNFTAMLKYHYSGFTGVHFITFAFLCILSLSNLHAQATQFPLKISADNRHLEDQAGIPFFVNGDTPWSLIAGLTESEAEIYLEDRKSRGFNAIITNLIEHKFTTSPPNNREGENPFLADGDFTQPNELYFAFADKIIQKATDKGFLIIITPAYMGYQCGDEGWCQEVKATSLDDLRAYGRYLGNRYKSFDNIIWMHGGDVAAGDYGALDHVTAIAEGIRESDPAKLFTAHSVRWNSSIDDYNLPWLEINSTYSDCLITAAQTKTDYQRSTIMPFFYAEGRYEKSNGATPDQCIRAQAYWSVLGGSIGHFFGNSILWRFDPGWEDALDLQGSQSMTHLRNLFTSRPWSLLVPDYAETIITGNRGAINSSDYVAAARASNGSFIMAYLPQGGNITVKMDKINGSSANAWWFNPANGDAQLIGNFVPTGLRDFSPPDNNDWVLVVDNTDLGFSAPGNVASNPTTQCNDGIDNDSDGLIDLNDPGCSNDEDNDEAQTLIPEKAGSNSGVMDTTSIFLLLFLGLIKIYKSFLNKLPTKDYTFYLYRDR